MWRSRLFWKLFLVASGVNLALAIAFLTIVSGWQEEILDRQIDGRLRDVATMLQSHAAERLDSGSLEELQTLVRRLARQTHIRMTIIAADGRVLADSEKNPEQMENHRKRREVAQALEKREIGRSQRTSPTLRIPMRYLAVPIIKEEEKSVVAVARVALDVEEIENQVNSTKRILWILAGAGAFLAILLSYAVVGRVIRPLTQLTQAAEAMTEGKQFHPTPVKTKDEIRLLADSFYRMQQELTLRVDQLADGNNRLKTILGSMTEGVIAIDADQIILLANTASGQLLGFSTADALGRSLQEVVRCRPLHETALNVLESVEPCPTEFEFEGETPRIFSAWAGPLPGDPRPGVLVVLHDVTELRRLETMRRDFVANVSHELKTPLSAIKAYAETLRLGALDDPKHNREFVERIEQQSDRLHSLILDLLVLARVESGEQKPQLASFSVTRLARARVQEHQHLAEEKNILLTVDTEEDIMLYSDEEGLSTILDNLLNNAINYTHSGGRVSLRWWKEDELCVIEVEDNGVGIAPQDQQRVFERFFRVDRARSREVGSTGLGLSIVKHLTQALGGSVELASRLGEGSRFTVKIPMIQTASQATPRSNDG